MGLDICISPIKSTIGTVEDYDSESQYNSEIAIIDNLINIIKNKIKDQTGLEANWNEEEVGLDSDNADEVNIFCERLGSYAILHQLRRYAAHIDVNNKPPEEPCELHEASNDQALLKIYDEEVKTQFPHLIDHSDCDGYYIPCEFSVPIWIQPSEIEMDNSDDDLLISVGSSILLKKELCVLNEYLKISTDELQDIENITEKFINDDWEFVKWCWAILFYMCDLSIKHNQPIIFC